MGSHWNNEQILREEIFSIERLEEHARSLAAAQGITRQPGFQRSLGARLRNNEKVLLAAYRSIARAVDEGRSITPAAEWVLDNYHVIEEQIREIREDLPPGFYRQLPKLADGPFAGFPRVFGIAWAFVAHTDSRFDPEFLRRFVHAYQTVEPLTIGELWAVAITLRVVLVENLRRVAQRIVASRAARQEADLVADRLLGVNGQSVNADALIEWQRRSGKITPAFAVQFVQRLRDQDPRFTPSLVWLENELRAMQLDTDRMVQEEHQRQGASNVTVRNIITSMRLMSDVDWAEFFESVSLVDEVLNASGEFTSMDFATRNLYRSAIEVLGRGSDLSELAIARRVFARAGEAKSLRERDPGFWLISEGRAQVRTRGGLSAVVARPSRPHRLHGGRRRLRGRDCLHLRIADRGAARPHAAVRYPRANAVAVGPARRRTGHGYRNNAGQPRRGSRRGREHPAGPGTARRRSSAPAHY